MVFDQRSVTQQLLDIFSLVLPGEDCTLPRTFHLLKKYFAVEKLDRNIIAQFYGKIENKLLQCVCNQDN